jgi:hypothetical protein
VKSRKRVSDFSSKKVKKVNKKTKRKKRLKRTSSKEKNDPGESEGKKTKDKTRRHKNKRQASYGTGLNYRTGNTGYNQAARSFARPVLTNTVDYSNPKAIQGTPFKSLQHNGPINAPSYTGKPITPYRDIVALNQYRPSYNYLLQRQTNGLKSTNSLSNYRGAASALPYIASTTRVPVRHFISTNTRPALEFGSSLLRPVVSPAYYGLHNAVRPNLPQIPLPSTVHGVPAQLYGPKAVTTTTFQAQSGGFMTAQGKSHIAKPVQYTAVRSGKQSKDHKPVLQGNKSSWKL